MRPVLPTRATELSHATVVNSVRFAQIRISSSPGIPVIGPNSVVDTTVDFKADHPFLYYILKHEKVDVMIAT
ncbi:hypothetical protein NQ318_010912 [Aromia moschata]|uniref:Serpin domain-containing protein n=1 Tax=Aromia moschata TaxID=1265417 RepID=A0AAV8XCY4_9CUCU|nr:hypothetical protein NQ318_010912 [Aromia moschata]